MKSAPTTTQHFLYGAAKIDVDHVKTGLDKSLRTGRKLSGLGSQASDGLKRLFWLFWLAEKLFPVALR